MNTTSFKCMYSVHLARFCLSTLHFDVAETDVFRLWIVVVI